MKIQVKEIIRLQRTGESPQFSTFSRLLAATVAFLLTLKFYFYANKQRTSYSCS